jgi:hypothetical protein
VAATLALVDRLREFWQAKGLKKPPPTWRDFLGANGVRRDKDDPAAKFLVEAHGYVRDYCAFVVGNWNSPLNMAGFAPTPKLDHFLRVFRERRIAHYVIDEFRTSKVMWGNLWGWWRMDGGRCRYTYNLHKNV